MPIFIPDPATILRTESLAEDLARIAAGDGPTRADLEYAPIIDGWFFGALPQACLIGRISGHPVLGSPRNAHTSMLFGIDSEAGWARTLSRWYRLGGQAIPGNDSNPRREQ